MFKVDVCNFFVLRVRTALALRFMSRHEVSLEGLPRCESIRCRASRTSSSGRAWTPVMPSTFLSQKDFWFEFLLSSRIRCCPCPPEGSSQRGFLQVEPCVPPGPCSPALLMDSVQRDYEPSILMALGSCSPLSRVLVSTGIFMSWRRTALSVQ